MVSADHTSFEISGTLDATSNFAIDRETKDPSFLQAQPLKLSTSRTEIGDTETD